MNILNAIFENVIHYLRLTLESDVLWGIIPLIIATVLIVAYYQKYNYEKPKWDSFYSNSIVLLFVSLALLRYIYHLDGLGGAYNFIDYSSKSIASVFILFLGFVLVKFNFEHLLPERYAKYIGSPITVNLVAYAVILFVYSNRAFSWIGLIALFLIVVVLSLILNSIKIPLHKIFLFIEKEKEKDEVKTVKELKFEVDELKRDVKERMEELNELEKEEVVRNKRIAKKVKKALR